MKVTKRLALATSPHLPFRMEAPAEAGAGRLAGQGGGLRPMRAPLTLGPLPALQLLGPGTVDSKGTEPSLASSGLPKGLERVSRIDAMQSATPALELSLHNVSATVRFERVAPGEIALLVRTHSAELRSTLRSVTQAVEAAGLRVRALRVVTKPLLR